MSYEGSREYLCVVGHSFSQDCYEDEPTCCIRCGKAIKYSRSIDHTNGDDLENPETLYAKIDAIGYEDMWLKDHYGNKYAHQIVLYKPRNPKEWYYHS